MDGCADAGVDDNLEEGKGCADGVRVEGECWGGCEETVHDVVRIRGQSDEEEKLGPLLDCADDSTEAARGTEPTLNGLAQKGPREQKDEEGAKKSGKVRDDSAGPGSIGISSQDNERGIERNGGCDWGSAGPI